MKNKQVYFWVKPTQSSEWEPAFYNGSVYITFPDPSHGISLRQLPEEFYAIDPTPFFRALEPIERLSIARHMLQMLADKFKISLEVIAFNDEQSPSEQNLWLTVMAPSARLHSGLEAILQAFAFMQRLWADTKDYGVPLVSFSTLLLDAENIELAKNTNPDKVFQKFTIN